MTSMVFIKKPQRMKKQTRSTFVHLLSLQLVFLLALTSLFVDGSQASTQHSFSLPTATFDDAIFIAATGSGTDETQTTSYIARFDLRNTQSSWKKHIIPEQPKKPIQISAIAISADTTKLAYVAEEADVDADADSTSSLLGILRTSDGHQEKRLERVEQHSEPFTTVGIVFVAPQ